MDADGWAGWAGWATGGVGGGVGHRWVALGWDGLGWPFGVDVFCWYDDGKDRWDGVVCERKRRAVLYVEKCLC